MSQAKKARGLDLKWAGSGGCAFAHHNIFLKELLMK